MPRVLVTGASGFVGRHLCPELVSAGLSTRAAVRKPFPSEPPQLKLDQCLVDHVGPDTDWSKALADVDQVVHLAARTHILREKSADALAAFRQVNVGGTRSLAQSCLRAGVRRFVLLSSIKALGEETTGERHFSEESPCHPVDPYGISKREAEQELLTVAAVAAMEIVILRAPLVYGPRVGANFLRLLKAIDRGLPLPLGSARNRRSFLFVGNLTSAILRALGHPAAAGQLFHVADENALSTRELVVCLAKAMKRPVRLWPVPVGLLRFAGKLIGRSEDVRRMSGSLIVSTTKIRDRLNWTPPFTTTEALTATVAWYEKNQAGSQD